MPRKKLNTEDIIEQVEVVGVEETKLTDLEKELSEMKEKEAKYQSEMTELKNMVLSMQTQQQSQQLVKVEEPRKKTTVKVVSLIPNTYNLSTSRVQTRDSKTFTFEKFGESKLIQVNDMLNILDVYAHQFEKGYAVLGSKEEYELLGYGYIYDSVMSKDTLEAISMLKKPEDVDAILELSEDMQEKMSFLIATNIANGVSYDYNRIKELEEDGLAVTVIADEIKKNLEKQ